MQNVLSQLPFNISLLVLNGENTKGLQQVKVLDIFGGGTAGATGTYSGGKNFHPEGLFSTEIFGKVGDERRNRLFGYIALNLPVFHPVIYKKLIELKELYGKIMSGSAYAVFNPKTKDFEPASVKDGQTGYAFFLKHFDELVFEERKSTSREFAIKLINSHRSQCLMDKLLIMPAGLRDFTILPNGKPEEDEINSLYRKILSIATVIGSHGKLGDQSHMDNSRYGLQIAIQELYLYIVNLLEGKNKLIQGWWTSRKIFQSTRNVITANVAKSSILGDPVTIGPNHTVVGLYQSLRSIFPLAVNLIRGVLSDVFPGPNSPASLVNKKTLLRENVLISPEYYDNWMTQEGLEATIGRFEPEALRHDEIEVDGRYLSLIYNDGKRVKLFRSIDELPEGFDKAHVKPVTFAELYYLAIFKDIKRIPAFVTRYPITGYGSIYPSWIYLKTTTRSTPVVLLDEMWGETEDIASEFPIRGQSFVNSMSPAGSHLGLLGADFDGDMMSLIAVMSDEGIEEIKDLLQSKNYYVGVSGKIAFSVSNDVSDLVFAEMTN